MIGPDDWKWTVKLDGSKAHQTGRSFRMKRLNRPSSQIGRDLNGPEKIGDNLIYSEDWDRPGPKQVIALDQNCPNQVKKSSPWTFESNRYFCQKNFRSNFS